MLSLLAPIALAYHFVSVSYSRYQVATGGGDDTIRIWDMRSLKSLYTIPAHLSNVSDVKFFQADDQFFKPSPPQLQPTDGSTDVHMSSSSPSPSSPKPPASESNAESLNPDKSHDAPPAASASGYTQEEWRYRSGLFLASSGYDGLVKLWSADDWQLLRTLTTDAGKVMSVDIASDGGMLASATYNRNFQLFAPEEVA